LLSQQRITAAEFASRAFAALPAEEPYTFHRVLSQGYPRGRRDPAELPAANEMALPERGWTIIIPPDAGAVLRQAAEDLRDYLETSMQVHMTVENRPMPAAPASFRQAIVAGRSAQLSGCGSGLRGPKDYQIVVSSYRVVVCGIDERGAMYGLHNL